MKLTNEVYDKIKWILTAVIPPIFTAIVTLNECWGWGLPIPAISISIGAVTTCLGAIINSASKRFAKEQKEAEKKSVKKSTKKKEDK